MRTNIVATAIAMNFWVSAIVSCRGFSLGSRLFLRLLKVEISFSTAEWWTEDAPRDTVHSWTPRYYGWRSGLFSKRHSALENSDRHESDFFLVSVHEAGWYERTPWTACQMLAHEVHKYLPFLPKREIRAREAGAALVERTISSRQGHSWPHRDRHSLCSYFLVEIRSCVKFSASMLVGHSH